MTGHLSCIPSFWRLQNQPVKKSEESVSRQVLALQSHPKTLEIRRLRLGKNRCQLSLSTGIAKLEP